jgi:putative membrane protein
MSFFSPYRQFPQTGLIHWLLLGIIMVVSIVASFNPLDFDAYLLHQSGTVLGISLLLFLQWQRCVSIPGFALTIIFILLHILGAHYLYSFVPYNEWVKHIFNVDMNQYFGWSRNMYDRLIHFAYGLLLFKICCDVFSVWLPQVKPFKIALLAIQFIMATSMVYELIEWLLAIGLSPEAAENYNGQQGDIWDAQKDMALATLGALCAALIQRIYLLFK